MKKWMGFAALLLPLTALPGCLVVAEPGPGMRRTEAVVVERPAPVAEVTVEVEQEPPAPQVEVVTVAPSVNHVWIGGWWARHRRGVWTPRYWVVRPPPRARW